MEARHEPVIQILTENLIKMWLGEAPVYCEPATNANFKFKHHDQQGELPLVGTQKSPLKEEQLHCSNPVKHRKYDPIVS